MGQGAGVGTAGSNHHSFCMGALMNTVNWVQSDAGTGLGIASVDVAGPPCAPYHFCSHHAALAFFLFHTTHHDHTQTQTIPSPLPDAIPQPPTIDDLCVCPLYKPCLGRCPWPFIFLVPSLPTALRPPFCGTATSAGPGCWSSVATVAMVVMVVMACGPGRLPAIDPRLLPWV